MNITTIQKKFGKAGMKLLAVTSLLSSSLITWGDSCEYGRILVQFKNGTTPGTVDSVCRSHGAQGIEQFEAGNCKLHIWKVGWKDWFRTIRNLERNPNVEFAEPDWVLTPKGTVTPNDPNFANQWHHSMIQSPEAWGNTTGASTVTVAILDTGVNTAHPDLAGNVVPGWNVFDNNSNTADVHGHGTTVAGVVGAVGNNATGVAGVAFTARIMPIRVTDTSGYAYYSTIAKGLDYAAARGVRVANISFEASNSSTVKIAAQNFQNKGGVVVIGSGNAGNNYPSSDNPYVLTVSGTTQTDVRWSSSNYGNLIDLAAPSVSIWTTTRAGGYTSASGTSYSAPIVSGVAALVLSANPNLSGVETLNLIKNTTDDLGTAGWDIQYGTGRVNASKAVAAAVALNQPVDHNAPSVAILSPSPSSLISGTVTIQVSASDDTALEEVQLILAETDEMLGSYTQGSISVDWDTTGWSNGTYNLVAQASDANGNVSQDSVSLTINNTLEDTTPPFISILSPLTNQSVINKLLVTTECSDDTAVTKVELYVNGTLGAVSTAEPFSFNYGRFRKFPAGTYQVQCLAYDAQGNVGASSIVTVVRP